MACGTGKTFTSLKIAENETGGKGLALFLAPSIVLVGQTLRKWTAKSSVPIFLIWASDRLDKQHGGIIAFVSNGYWLDGNAMDGFHKCLEAEFSGIYVFFCF